MSRSKEIAAGAVVAALFVAIRWPLYTQPGLLLGWNSDAALFGLMARAMAEGSDFPLFFWGQPYLGTITSMLAAAIALGQPAGPLALRIAAAVEIALGIALFTAGLRRAFGAPAAWLAAAWLVAGPFFLFHATVAPIGGQLFLVAALLFWFVVRSPMTTARAWFTAGLIFGFAMYVHQGAAFLAAAAGVALLVERLATPKRIAAGLAGAVLGYLPAAVALLRGDVRLYRRTYSAWSVGLVGEQAVQTLTSDLWLLLGERSAVGIAAGLVLLLFAATSLRDWNRGRMTACGTIVISLCFWIFSTYPYPGAVRYIAPALPMVYGFAAAAMVAWLRRGRTRAVAAAVSIVLVALPMVAARAAQARDVAAGRGEQYANWPGGFDPRPVLQQIRDGGYAVCYGEVWVAHKLEFLSEPTVRFVVVRSVHRTLPRSLPLLRQPGRKCFVENDGRVRALTADEERLHRESVELRARKAGLGRLVHNPQS